ncbi:MAG: molybdopterin biosynthesis protein [Planctomycetota bacterium]|nr:molybdopterin biosynthesis protein [Planctomycetota bacterium]
MKQEQFLDVATVDDACRRWEAKLELGPRPDEIVALRVAHGRVLSADVVAPGDVPAFDRSNVDGFAVQAKDTFGASEREPVTLTLLGQPIDAGHAPEVELEPGTACVIATGGVVPRGADAIVMVEDTESDGQTVRISSPVAPGARISIAGSDIARGELVLRRGTLLSARETGTLAACGIDRVWCVVPLRVAIVSTGDEIVPPGAKLRPGQVHDANATMLADALRELGAEPHILGIARDDESELQQMLAMARTYDAALLSGGTSKGGGDLSYRVLHEMAEPVVHGIALKPGKPLCLSVWDGKPVAVLPGFPTSAIFTFHAVVAPFLRRLIGRRVEEAATVTARLPRDVRSVRGRREFNLVNLVRGRDGFLAFPLGKGSGSVTTFARADGFFDIAADEEYAEADDTVKVTLLGRDVHPADVVVIGSHCTGVDIVLEAVITHGFDAKVIATGSRGGVEAAAEGACDLAPVHLLDEASGTWNAPFAADGVRVLQGYVRRQGLAFREEHAERFAGDDVPALLQAAVTDPELRIANRNPGSGTRILIDGLFPGEERVAPPGWSTAYRSHTAVASAIAQERADYGICLEQAATAAGLRWIPWCEEHLDFLVPADRWERPGVRAFRAALADDGVRAALTAAGFQP